MDIFEKGAVAGGTIILLCIIGLSIYAVTEGPSNSEYYGMFSKYINENYQNIEVLEYSKENDEKITVTHRGGYAEIVTYAKVDGIEKLISCEIRDIIGDYGPEPYYTYNIMIYN